MLTSRPPTGDAFAQLAAGLRPRLHRYCARLTGSVLDGEDLVQETLIKAALNFDRTSVQNAEAWLFGIAHNSAMDLLRRRRRDASLFEEAEGLEQIAADTDDIERMDAAAFGLRVFMRLPVFQRAAVILSDVLEHSLDECAQILGATLSSTKAALHRGRVRLRAIAAAPQPATALRLSEQDRELLQQYVVRFNARDFDALRGMLAEHVRLDLVGRHLGDGRAVVSNYFGNYAELRDVRGVAAVIEGWPAMWIHEGNDPDPRYLVVLRGSDGRVEQIRDFRYARYVMEALRPGVDV